MCRGWLASLDTWANRNVKNHHIALNIQLFICINILNNTSEPFSLGPV
jgi:hypothetical protein